MDDRDIADLMDGIAPLLSRVYFKGELVDVCYTLRDGAREIRRLRKLLKRAKSQVRVQQS